MAGDEGGVAGEVEPGLCAQRRHHGEAHRHERGLRIGGQRQLGLGPFEHKGGQLLPKRIVDFVEDLACRGKGFGQRLAHADGLRPLAGKHEGPHRSGDEQNGGMGARARIEVPRSQATRLSRLARSPTIAPVDGTPGGGR